MADFQDKTKHMYFNVWLFRNFEIGLSSNYILDLNFDNITQPDIIDVHFEKYIIRSYFLFTYKISRWLKIIKC